MEAPLSKWNILNDIDILENIILRELLRFIDLEYIHRVFLLGNDSENGELYLLYDAWSSHYFSKVIIVDTLSCPKHAMLLPRERVLDIVVNQFENLSTYLVLGVLLSRTQKHMEMHQVNNI